VVVAWHGLARTGRDMDDLAAHLAQRWRVICPDTLGRGLSQWSPRPTPSTAWTSTRAGQSLLDQLGVDQCHWVGTSMGGAIGLVAAAGALRGRIQRLVLNDIGPELARAAIERIRSYAGSPPAFATVQRAGAVLPHRLQALRLAERRAVAAPDRDLVRRLPDGRVTPHYDPAMVQQFVHHPTTTCAGTSGTPGPSRCCACAAQASDLLLPDVAEQMRQRGPRAVVVDHPRLRPCAGAAPAQWALVERFLAGR
jgi:pimeloyl-ACP methyl ester carboxylesterase